MAKFAVLAGSLTVLGLAAMVYHSLAEEEAISVRFDDPVTASSTSDAARVTIRVDDVSPSIPSESTRGSHGMSDAGSRVEVGRARGETVLVAPASAATPTVPPSSPVQQKPVIESTPLGPSPGAQVSREVFAEDVIARRAAYGKSARTLPAEEELGN